MYNCICLNVIDYAMPLNLPLHSYVSFYFWLCFIFCYTTYLCFSCISVHLSLSLSLCACISICLFVSLSCIGLCNAAMACTVSLKQDIKSHFSFLYMQIEPMSRWKNHVQRRMHKFQTNWLHRTITGVSLPRVTYQFETPALLETKRRLLSQNIGLPIAQ